MAKRTTRLEHPFFAVFTHWIHVMAMAVLIETGLFIHSPFYAAPVSVHRTIHLVAGFVLVGTGIGRIYWAVFGRGSADIGSRKKIKDFHFFMPDRKNRGTLWPMVKYYLFLRKTHPRVQKYNPIQKIAYVALFLVMLLSLITGLEMWLPTRGFLEPLTYFLGGTLVVHIIHYFTMWSFIVITMVHIYLTVAEAPWEIPLMWLWKEKRVPGGSSQREGADKGLFRWRE